MKLFHFTWLLVLLLSCGSKQPKTMTDEDLTVADFVALAPDLSYPILVNDALLNRQEKDSLLINQVTYKTFLPDTVYQRLYPKPKNLKLYLLGKSADGEKGHYLLVKSALGKERGAQLLYFSKKSQFVGVLDIGTLLPKGNLPRHCKIDKNHSISFVQERKTPTGELWTRETIYFMNDSGRFIIAMTNSTEDLSDIIMGNPIDTLSRKQKYTADYATDKKNLISIRDGATEKSFEFFIHFSKQNGDCIGELKGTGEWIEKNKGIFKDGNSDCVITFDFTTNAVRIQEQNCGLYRGITCFFEGSYPRKKEAGKKSK
jgi:hypothetical protein